MAVFTNLSEAEATGLLRVHGLDPLDKIETISAGSVNSNFFLHLPNGKKVFARIYEEQEADGVAYEWTLLDHLLSRGIPVPRRVPGSSPGQCRVSGKPTALFEIVGGEESCQASVSQERAFAVGQAIASVHLAAADFTPRKESRFRTQDIERRLRLPEVRSTPTLAPAIAAIRRALETVRQTPTESLPRGVIHGDLFRDNVRWEGSQIVAIIDWESASDGDLIFDLVVTLLAWCFGDEMDWGLGRALFDGYRSTRELEAAEWRSVRVKALLACARFTATRITDFHLRKSNNDRVIKDYRRFLERMNTFEPISDLEVAQKLGLRRPEDLC
ncbi:MAG: homoserine kinase [Myxococcota bacterium]